MINNRTAVPSRLRALSTPLSVTAAHHNWIASVAEAGFAPAKDGFYAAKQAAPPRGVPR